ncbi:Os02g0222500, partial [Oryza sativa Japonica Group]
NPRSPLPSSGRRWRRFPPFSAAAAAAFAWRTQSPAPHRGLLHRRVLVAPLAPPFCNPRGTIGPISSCKIPPLDLRSNRRSTCSTSFIDGRIEGCSPVQITASVNTSNASSTWVGSLIPSSRRSTDKPYSWYCLHAHCAKQ